MILHYAEEVRVGTAAKTLCGVDTTNSIDAWVTEIEQADCKECIKLYRAPVEDTSLEGIGAAITARSEEQGAGLEPSCSDSGKSGMVLVIMNTTPIKYLCEDCLNPHYNKGSGTLENAPYMMTSVELQAAIDSMLTNTTVVSRQVSANELEHGLLHKHFRSLLEIQLQRAKEKTK